MGGTLMFWIQLASTNSIDLSTIIISVVGSIGVGSIISVILGYYLSNRKSISTIDQERFDFYKYIYFSAVVNPVYDTIPKEQATKFLQNLYSQINLFENKALLLSKPFIVVLRRFHQNPKKHLRAVQSRIKSDFKPLLKKHDYYKNRHFDKIKYFIVLCVFFVLTMLDLSIIINLISGAWKTFSLNGNLFLWCIFLFALLGIFYCFDYSRQNSYIFDRK